jgi:diacylglycerol kinase (ATP)
VGSIPPAGTNLFHFHLGQFDILERLRQHGKSVMTFSPAEPPLTDLLLVNPAAGGGRAKDVLPALREFASRRRWQVEICVAQSSAELGTKAQAAAAAGRKRILVLGGDGTFQVLANALADFPEVILGVIPAGGGNDLAVSLGLSEDPVEAASQLLDGEVCFLDAARVRTAEGRERLYAGGGGVGLDAEAARYASGVYRHLRGRFRYLLSIVRALLGFHAPIVRISATGQTIIHLEAKALLVGVLNTPNYGASLYLAPDAKTDDGQLDLVVLDDLTFVEVLALLPSLALRGELTTNRVSRFAVSSVWIETPSPSWFHGDGELIGTTPVEVSVVPRAFRVLCASRKAAG